MKAILSRLLKKMFGGSRPAGKHQRYRCRPRVEGLEDRTVPSQLAWTNGTGNGLWNVAANWTDTLDSSHHAVPGTGDYAIFGSGLGRSNTNCTMNMTTETVNRLSMESGYTATLTI